MTAKIRCSRENPRNCSRTKLSPASLVSLLIIAPLALAAPSLTLATKVQAAEPQKTVKSAPDGKKAPVHDSAVNFSNSSPREFKKHRFRINSLTKEERVLEFPDDTVVGSILIKYASDDKAKNANKLNKAKGKMFVPAGGITEFFPNDRFFANPSLLNKLKANAIDGLRMKFFPMDEAEEGRGDRGLAYMSRFSGLIYVDFDRSEVSDRGLAALKTLKHLELISGFGSSIDGSAFKEMGRMESVTTLRLPNTNPKMEALNYVPTAFPNLVYLNLSRTRLTNRVMPAIARCSKLEHLDISDNSFITDEAVESLLKLRHLRLLEVGETSMTARGLAKLKELPIEHIVVTGNQFKQGELEKLQNNLKPIKFTVLTKRLNRNIDSDTETLFGPMSRGRGL